MSKHSPVVWNVVEPISYDINLPYRGLTAETGRTTNYPDYLPSFDPIFFDPLLVFDFVDPALLVEDKSLPNLITSETKLTSIQPALGTIVEGVQLLDMSNSAKEELALLISQRKAVVFPNQDRFMNAGPTKQQEFMKFFGKPNYQPVSGSVKGHPGFHIIHRDGNKEEIARFLSQKATTTLWHQDVSYEIQPPGYVMLGLLQGPEVGGDTVFAATDLAYKRLSSAFQKLFDNLEAVHSSVKMISQVRERGKLKASL
ncbi:TauD-domain-containing protein [Tothia fuscella]|uniref:TauD-domain-containing protein n=1 Tax=Tothia fuscella TaxID=1048955 RepID=A0A9P4TTT1_9PEZI|nr:TauD-domain-containing protein [Tothia fuscella]